MRNTLYFSVIISMWAGIAKGQQNLGVATSNWSGMNSLYLNPANIADSREKMCFDVFMLNTGVDNSLGYLNANGGLVGSINSGNTTNMFAYSNNGSFSLLAPYADVHLPGFMINLDHKNSIALTTRIRGINQFDNFDQSLFHTITDPSYTSGTDFNLTSGRFNYTAHLWSEIGLSYGGVILDQGCSELKVGVTLRYLGGIGYIGLKSNNLNVHYRAGNDSLFVTNSDLEFASNIVSTRNALLNGFTNNSILSEFFGAKNGMGAGGDVGVVYDYIPNPGGEHYFKDHRREGRDHSKNRYKFRVSASVVDIGAITYQATNNFAAKVTGNGYVTGKGLSDNVSNYNDFRNYAVKQGFTADTGRTDTKVYMPTTLHVGADYHIWDRLYVNATYIASLANRDNFGNSYYNQVTVTPRYDTRMLSFGLPISYSMLSNTMKAGLGIRFYGFVVGSDDMLVLFTSHQYGFNFYVGGFVPIDYSRPRYMRREWRDDRDSLDMSPEPDMEHGGSADSTDNCPDLFYQYNNLNEPVAPAAPGRRASRMYDLFIDKSEADRPRQ